MCHSIAELIWAHRFVEFIVKKNRGGVIVYNGVTIKVVFERT